MYHIYFDIFRKINLMSKLYSPNFNLISAMCCFVVVFSKTGPILWYIITIKDVHECTYEGHKTNLFKLKFSKIV